MSRRGRRKRTYYRKPGQRRFKQQRLGRGGRYRKFYPGYDRTSGFYGRFGRGGAETKFFDTDVSAIIAAIATGMEASLLTIIPQGTTESQRIGRKVTLKRLDVKGTITLPTVAVAASTSDNVRILIVCDKQTNGAAFAATQLWDDDDFGSFNNLANSHRFQVLASKNFNFSASAGSGRGTTDTLSWGEVTKSFKFNIDLNLPIEYDNTGTDGAITTHRSNSLWLITQSTNGLVVMTFVTARVRYIDG